MRYMVMATSVKEYIRMRSLATSTGIFFLKEFDISFSLTMPALQ